MRTSGNRECTKISGLSNYFDMYIIFFAINLIILLSNQVKHRQWPSHGLNKAVYCYM